MDSDILIIDDELEMFECSTDFYSPCCETGGIYAHFFGEELCGFQCTECGKDYAVTCKEGFVT